MSVGTFDSRPFAADTPGSSGIILVQRLGRETIDLTMAGAGLPQADANR